MRKIVKKIGLIALMGFTLNACNDLDKNPYESLAGTEAFRSVEDADFWVNGRYSALRARVYGEYMFLTDVQADLLNATTDFGNNHGPLHRWADLTSSERDVTEIYKDYYSALDDINFALEGFETIPTSTDEEKTRLAQYKAELHLFRAYYYSQLVLRYSKAYDPATAQTEKNIPLVLKFDMEALPERATTQQIYDQILSDLAIAEKGMAAVQGKVGSSRFTKDAVKILKARVSLYTQNWQQAYAEASALVDAGTYPLAANQEAFKDIWHKDTTTESICQLFVENPDERTNTNSLYLEYSNRRKKYSPLFIPTQALLDKYEDSDFRKNVFFEQKRVFLANRDFNLTLVNKFPGNPALFTSNFTNYRHFPKVFRVAEAYLIASEAAYKLNDETNAKKYLNLLRTARGLAEVSSMGEDLFQAIKDERLRELAFEGMRLDDLKRWKQNVVRGTPQNTEAIFQTPTPEQYHQLNRSYSDEKIVWEVSEREKELNPNLRK